MSTYSEAYDEGHAAYSANESLIANPYYSGTFKALAWVYGWLDAQTEDRGIGGTGEPKLPIL